MMEMSTLKRTIIKAIKKQEFKLYYQPIVSLSTGAIAGHEALIRWHHPADDLLMPLDFIPECECDPLIMVEICEFVIKQAWRDRKKLPSGFISVNISPTSLEMKRFWEMLDEYALINDRPVIYLEITERLLAQYKIVAPYWANKQRAIGAFIDDLGIGESSYVQVAEILKWFPTNDFVKVKLDIAFAKNLHEMKYRWFAKSIIDSMHYCPSGRIEVIAEGIEHEWQRDIFTELGCDYGQGWLFGRPIPV